MKNTLTIITILITLSCKAQSPIVSFTDYYENDAPDIDNMYIKDIEGYYDPYIGLWSWNDSTTNSLLTIELYKVEMVYYESSSTKEYCDRLYGRMKYVNNGQEIFNTLVDGIDVLIDKGGIPLENTLDFSYKDPLNPNKYGYVEIELFDNNNKAKFYLRNNEGVRVLPAGLTSYDANFSIPRRTEFILDKQ